MQQHWLFTAATAARVAVHAVDADGDGVVGRVLGLRSARLPQAARGVDDVQVVSINASHRDCHVEVHDLTFDLCAATTSP